MRVHGRNGPPYRFHGSAVECHYEPSVVVHPMWRSDSENTLIRFGGDRQEAVAVSAELPPPDGYGVRTGYEARVRADNVRPDGTGWHTAEVTVWSHAHYALRLDGEILADVIERTPATMTDGPVGVGLRVDFLDVEVADPAVEAL